MKVKERGNPSSAYSYRKDPSVPAFPGDRPIVIFDGNSVLCLRFARFVLRHDRRVVFRLMAAQTSVGQALYRHLHLDPAQFETNVLLEGGQAWCRSAGTIRMFVHLGFPWSLCGVLSVLPQPWLDRLYDLIACNRLRWFGSQSGCFLADPGNWDRSWHEVLKCAY